MSKLLRCALAFTVCAAGTWLTSNRVVAGEGPDCNGKGPTDPFPCGNNQLCSPRNQLVRPDACDSDRDNFTTDVQLDCEMKPITSRWHMTFCGDGPDTACGTWKPCTLISEDVNGFIFWSCTSKNFIGPASPQVLTTPKENKPCDPVNNGYL